jgi:glycosyltransferase involved in cell wall biosynthesis
MLKMSVSIMNNKIHVLNSLYSDNYFPSSLDRSKMALLMMVKNEHLRLEVSFESVRPYCDTFIILDTGSTDNTIEICKTYCKKHNITLFLKEEPFVNFKVSRNVSLDFADEVLKDDRYLLFLDCNDELKSGPELMQFVQTYNGPATGFFLKQRWLSHGKIDSYFNIRMVKAHKQWRYESVVHEYIKTDKKEFNLTERLENVILFQDRTKDDDKSQKRFKRDKVMLFDQYLKTPEDPRTLFYYAQTLSCLSEHTEAYKFYLLRTKYNGFVEEIFHSYIRLGEISMMLQHPWEEAQTFYLKAFSHSQRCEPLCHLARRYIEYNVFGEKKPDWFTAYMYLSMACKLSFPINQVLFIDSKAYYHSRWQLLGKVAFEVQQYKEGKDAIIKALQYEENEEDYNILCKYLRMDQTVNNIIKMGSRPELKCLTYFNHENLMSIPPIEEMDYKTHYKIEKKKVLENALKRILKK